MGLSARPGHMTGRQTEIGLRRVEDSPKPFAWAKPHTWEFIDRREVSCNHPRDCVCFERVSDWVCKVCGERGLGSWDEMYEYGHDCYWDHEPESSDYPRGCESKLRTVYDILNS